MALSRSFRIPEALAICQSVPLSVDKSIMIPLTKRAKAPLHAPLIKYPFHPTSHLLTSRVSVAICGLSMPMQIRLAHTDVTNVPDFTAYRVSSTKSPTSRASESSLRRKAFSYLSMFVGTVCAATATKYSAKTLIMPLGPSAKTLAEASTEVNLASIPEGKNLVVKWRNRPLFVRHRTAEEISRERAVSLDELRDPEPDEKRVQRDEWLVCVGVCTHLGCVPIANAGDFPGGFYCPCHGSHYDASGRARKGPAPLNLEIPPYKFLDDSTIVVG
ncbi:unnamed protein product [Dicrocoelium dendriticum]|nr:unnamed protein product [Dicrocoelium dendriticum]